MAQMLWYDNPCPAAYRYVFLDNVDPDQLDSEEAIWLGSAVFSM